MVARHRLVLPRSLLLLLLLLLALLYYLSPWLRGRAHAWRPQQPLLAAVAAAAKALTEDRRPSPPLVTGDGFRAHADHICDETTCALAPTLRAGMAGALRAGDVVFTKMDSLQWYLELVAEAGRASGGSARAPPPHIVVAHNGDLPVDEATALALARAPSVCALFAPNIAAGVRAPRLRALPIGTENRPFTRGHCPALYAGLSAARGFRALAGMGEALLAALAALGAPLPPGAACAGAGRGGTPPAAAGPLAPSRRLILAAFSLSSNPEQRGRALAGLARLASATLASDTSAIGDAYVQGVASAEAAAAGAPFSEADMRALAARVATWVVDDGPLCGAAAVNVTADAAPAPPSAGAWAAAALRNCGARDSLVDEMGAFFALVEAHPFVASPPGNGLQSHRTWEALHLGRVPVVQRTLGAMDDLYAGLPVLIIDGWAKEEGEEAGRARVGPRPDLVSHELLLGALERIAAAARNTAAGAPEHPLDPRLLSRSPELLAGSDRRALARATLHPERVLAAHWEATIDSQRASCRSVAGEAA